MDSLGLLLYEDEIRSVEWPRCYARNSFAGR
jgi:hypothetical protein